ncbi:hypothetical protein Tco_1291876 [Tanacetum coccineum]
MHNMGKTVGELHALLIEYEKGLPKMAATPQVMAIQGGRTRKPIRNRKLLKARRPSKDDACPHCKEVGHWKRNYPVYLAELIVKKKQVGTASSSEAAKFLRDFKSLAKEADESFAKHKALEYEIERLSKAVVSQDIMSIVQKCKYDKISYDKAYNDMQQKIKRFQAQLGDLKGKSKDTPCVSDTLDPLFQKLEDENVALEFQVPPKVVESNDLAHPVTSNSVPTTKESKVVKNDKVIALGMFRINPFNTSRKDKFVPINQARASVRTKSVAVSQPQVVTKKDVNSDSNSCSFTGVDITAKTRRPQPRSNTKTDRVPSTSKSSLLALFLYKSNKNVISRLSHN